MNLWVGTGQPTGDPDVRVSGDTKYARYTLAVDRGIRKDPNKPDQQTADFIQCVCYGRNADFADNYIRKGMKIAVTGRIQTGRYTNKDGQTVYTTDVVVDRHEFCESKSAQGTQQAQAPKTAASKPAASPDDSFVTIPENIDLEVPFS